MAGLFLFWYILVKKKYEKHKSILESKRIMGTTEAGKLGQFFNGERIEIIGMYN